MGKNSGSYLALVIIGGLAWWFVVGEPIVTIANPLLARDASAVACRAWVYDRAAANSDPTLTRGDYDRGIGFLRNMGPPRIYRLTVR